MTGAAVTVLGTYVLQLAGALVLAAVIGRFHRLYPRDHLRDWHRSFLALAVYVATAGLAFAVSTRFPPWHPARVADAFVSLSAGYLQVVWLLSGTYALKTGRAVSRRTARRLLVGAVTLAAVLCVLFVWDAGASTERLVARVGVRAAVAAAAFWAAAYGLLRRGGWRSGIGVRIVAIAFLLYGVDQLQLFLVPFTGLLGRLDFEYGVLAGSLDLVLLFAVGLGLVTWFLDEERAAAEGISRELAASEARFRVIARQTGQILYEHDLPTDRVRWAGAIEEITGIAESAFADVPMRGWLEEIHPDDRESAAEARREALAAGGRFRVEYRRRRANGGWVAIEEHGLVSLNDSGPRRVLGALADVGERKESEAARAQLETRLLGLRRLESLGRLAGGVAHDFNNLLTPVIGYAEMLALELSPDDPKRSELAEIRDAARQAVDLTRQLLAFGRKLVLELRPVDLNEVVGSFERVLRRMLREDIAIELRLGQEVWAVDADAAQIEHALLDLALNAQDAMPEGGILTFETANIVLDQEYVGRHVDAAPGPHVLLVVSDTGRGMTPDEVERIFEPFYSTKERGRGTGLGLATVYGIVRQHGGSIWAYSEPGRGSTFKIYLPRAGDAGPQLRVEPVGEPPRGDETVLVVEDDPAVRRLVCSVLAGHGYRVLEAEGGERALGIAADHPGEIHLLVSDVVMPGLKGPELYERLREVRPGLRALFMSGYTDDVIAARGMLEAGLHFIQKPFSVHLLVHKVRAALDG